MADIYVIPAWFSALHEYRREYAKAAIIIATLVMSACFGWHFGSYGVPVSAGGRA